MNGPQVAAFFGPGAAQAPPGPYPPEAVAGPAEPAEPAPGPAAAPAEGPVAVAAAPEAAVEVADNRMQVDED